MKLLDVIDLFNLISRGSENAHSRKLTRVLRKNSLASTINCGLTKLAFDTRRIDQETEFNPRRGLQNYNRSEAFLNEAMSQKIKNFSKLRKILHNLKNVYGKESEWQDSNARVLLSNLEKGLRTDTMDGDFTDSQPGMGSFNYIEELMHVRYRLGFDELTKLGESELEKIILSKDEELIHKNIKQDLEITKQDIGKHGYDTLLEKLFDGCKASADNPDVERTITITIRDRFHKTGNQ